MTSDVGSGHPMSSYVILCQPMSGVVGMRVLLYGPRSGVVNLRRPMSPYVALCCPTSPYVALCLPPYVALCRPMSPYVTYVEESRALSAGSYYSRKCKIFCRTRPKLSLNCAASAILITITITITITTGFLEYERTHSLPIQPVIVTRSKYRVRLT